MYSVVDKLELVQFVYGTVVLTNSTQCACSKKFQ